MCGKYSVTQVQIWPTCPAQELMHMDFKLKPTQDEMAAEKRNPSHPESGRQLLHHAMQMHPEFEVLAFNTTDKLY